MSPILENISIIFPSNFFCDFEKIKVVKQFSPKASWLCLFKL